jgi:germination protein M
MNERTWILVVLLSGVLAAGAVYLRDLAQRMALPPQAPHAEEVARAKLSEAALQATSPHETAKLYFPSYEEGALVEETRPISWAESDADRIRQVILALVEGSRQGLGRALPPTASIRGVFLGPDGTAYIDFSRQMLPDFNPGIASESLAVDALVNSVVTNIPDVKRIRILIQGQAVETLEGHADLSEPLAPALTRTAPNP